jgi:transposase-like protein
MDRVANDPNTLQEAVVYFADADNCLNYLSARRWPNGVICPTCGSKNIGFIASRRMFQCKTRHPKAQFSVKLGTIFEDSPLGLEKWLPAMWMIASDRNGISSWELHRALGVTQKTAWFMLHRIRLAMQDEQTGGKLSGKSRLTRPSSGRRLATCTLMNAPRKSPAQGVKARRL